MSTETIAGLRTDRFGDGSTHIIDLEFALEQAEDTIGCEKAADASHVPGLKRFAEQFACRALDSGAKDVDDRTAELLEVRQLCFVLRDACATKKDDVACVASNKKLVGNRRSVSDETHGNS